MKAGQSRVRLGPMECLPAGRNPARQQLWAVPGGAAVTFGDLVAYAQRMGWQRPKIVWVSAETGGRHG
jgi:hypothetical protein